MEEFFLRNIMYICVSQVQSRAPQPGVPYAPQDLVASVVVAEGQSFHYITLRRNPRQAPLLYCVVSN